MKKTRLKSRTIYRRTISFVLLKLAVNAVCVLASFAVLLLLYAGMKNQWKTALILAIFGLWTLITLTVYPLIDRFGGYLIRAGHIAAIAESVKSGQVPASPVAFGVKKVRKRFPLTATYYVVHNLVDKSIKQIARLLWRFTSDITVVLNLSMLNGLMATYMKIAVGSIDDCCIGYTFMHPELGPMQCACDGVVLYAANWKDMTKCAASTLGWATVLCAAFLVVPVTVVLISIFSVKTLSLWSLPILLFALYTATSVKSAVLDSYVVCRMVSKYYECAMASTLSSEYYAELKAASGKFRSLCAAAKKENAKRKSKKRQPDE